MEWILILMVAVVGAALLYHWSNGKKTYHINEQASFHERIKNLQVESTSVDVEIVKADGDEWKVTLSGTVHENDRKHFVLFHEQEAENLTVKVMEEKTKIGIQMRKDMKLLIEVPAETIRSIKVETSSADIDVDGLAANHSTFTASSGDVTVADVVQENLHIQTSSGDVLLKKVQSRNTDIHTSSGELFGENFDYGTGMFGSSSGEIRVQATKMHGDVKAATSSGDIRFFYEEEPSSCTLIYHSNSGEAKINWTGFHYDVKKENEVRGIKAEGEFHLTAETSSGDLRVG
ncbi:DUF4097 family beta strand repeat-containing protein [Halobacillus sp. HZG1]|uniref:DUF4097 family beta strand repeat-containing protein n=1 Tax=Halobacillus sp. HZG1 TaxID=3111769 RepID=UPI002DB83F55|nr:DUF4097 family beta strand repeat-containing protein [Halobacillus sp. HZG1]MEC3885696.1 DUF4097 family beta strand repeat-containing protein [Halobacillus sp. HZG1]